MIENDIELRLLRGQQLLGHLDALARLRIAVFRDWPYLYDGDLDYERDYLAAYAKSADSFCALALANGEAVGASTGIPLADDAPGSDRAFVDAGMMPEDVFYFGESILLPAWRGHGLGHRFFDLREEHARSLGRFRWTAFCAVRREPNDPRRPVGHRNNDRFWQGRGYVRQPGMSCELSWKEVGAEASSTHRLDYWLREWPAWR
ncbi:MAG: GNAT family N-acetyltransferase [Lysobacteraceae bacterium]